MCGIIKRLDCIYLKCKFVRLCLFVLHAEYFFLFLTLTHRFNKSIKLHLCFFMCVNSTYNMSHVLRKTAFCICENKDTDQLCGTRKADQRLCFHYIESTVPLLPIYTKFQSSSHLLWLYSPVCVRPGPKSRRPVFSQRDSYNMSP